MTYSDKAKQMLDSWADKKVPIVRPKFDEIYINMAFEVAKRSHDSQTKHGCVLVKDHRPIMTGYNGFIRDIEDDVLPNVRPDKYPWMIHAEHNCILSCARNGIPTLGTTAYITGEPCSNCLQFMWQAGVSRIVFSNVLAVMIDEEEKAKKQIIMSLIGDRLRVDSV